MYHMSRYRYWDIAVRQRDCRNIFVRNEMRMSTRDKANVVGLKCVLFSRIMGHPSSNWRRNLEFISHLFGMCYDKHH